MVSVYRKMTSSLLKLNWILAHANDKSADKHAQPEQHINNLVIHSLDILARVQS